MAFRVAPWGRLRRAVAPPDSASDARHGDEAIETELATSIVRRHVAANLTVTQVRKLCGGSINSVLELITDGRPASVVVKLNRGSKENCGDDCRAFQREIDTLRLFRETTRLPVPTTYALLSDEPGLDACGILMDKVDGVPLSSARMSPRGAEHLQHELGEYLAELHTHHRDRFGSAFDPTGHVSWLKVFGDMMASNLEDARESLNSQTRHIVDDVLADLDQWLPDRPLPTLVHGDLWATNILVDDSHPDRPHVRAFIDSNASYCDAEYELAYLRVFKTVDEHFFHTYSTTHTILPGFERRCMIYWLNTYLLHVWLFGGKYVTQCEDMARRIKQAR